MKMAIFDTKTTLEATDSDPRLQLLKLAFQVLGRTDEATVSGNVSKNADTANTPAPHQLGTLAAL
jgi:hypothetical protein